MLVRERVCVNRQNALLVKLTMSTDVVAALLNAATHASET